MAPERSSRVPLIGFCNNNVTFSVMFCSSEEVLNSDHALYFSKDGKYLTYIQFDDTAVKDFVFSWFGSSDSEYISQHKIAYPKPGTGNPKVKVNVIDLDTLPVDTKKPPVSKMIQIPKEMQNM